MIYLNNEELLENIEDYIDRDSKYAILIDGEWGCGKTNFIENKLLPKLKDLKKSHVYTTLYGITQKKEIDQKIVEQRLEECSKIGGILKFAYKNTYAISELIKLNFKDEAIKELFKDDSIKNVIDKFSVADGTILIFDDLERCTLSFNELLGYINDYVEHKNCKVIIVANQKEIAKSKRLENMELKYLVAKPVNCIYNSKNEKNPEISKYDLDNKVKEIFEDDLEYKQIREKVIGRTFYYKPNLKEILKEIVCSSKIEDTNKEFILENSKDIIRILEYYRHSNIRTLKFSIELMEKIFSVLDKMNIKEEQKIIFQDCKYNILLYTIYASILEKIGLKRKKWNFNLEYTLFTILKKENVMGFKFIDEFIDTGVIDENKTIEIISVFLKEMELKEIDLENPLNKLVIMWELDDDEVLKELNRLVEYLKNKKYEVAIYPKIIEILVKVKYIGFKDKIIEDIIAQLEKNIKSEKNNVSFNEFGIGFDTDEEIKEYKEIINHLKNIAHISYTEQKEEIIDKISSEKDWGVNISQYYLENKEDRYFDQCFLKLFDIDKLITNIIESDSKNINYFRRTMNDIYEYDNIIEKYSNDFENMEKLKNEIEVAMKNGRIVGITKKYNIELLINNINEIMDKVKLMQR